MDLDKDFVKRVYGRYEDEQLKNEYSVFTSIYDIENWEDTILVDTIDESYMILLEEIAQRFVQAPGKNVIYLKLND